MLVNSGLTVYHKWYDEDERLEKWKRFNYISAWWFGGKGAGINKGYENANDVQIRIPYDMNNNLDFKNFAIGESIYKITALINNTFGNNPHIHIGGR